MKDKKQVVEEVTNLIASFTDKNLTEEEKRICLHIWERLTRKRTIELTRGRPDIWAAATIWSFCRANFKYEEGITLELVCSFFNNKKSTVGNKAGEISKILKIDFFNPEFTTEALQKKNPVNKFSVTNDGFIIPRGDDPDSEKLNRYLSLRSAQQRLNHVLPDILPPGAMEECGRRLGLFHDNTFILGAQSEMDILMDYSLYDYRWDGQNAIERYARQTFIEDGSDERIVLDAMLKPRYSLFRVDEVMQGFGVSTQDLFRGDQGLIIDIAWSKTAIKGSVLACRVISPAEGFSMSTGAGLPVDREAMGRIASEIPQRFGKTASEIVRMSHEKAAEFSTSIIRILLEDDAASYMGFEEVTAQKLYAHLNIGRNDPCPCGSGKKYKKCCGR